jgi:hypothetical protein
MNKLHIDPVDMIDKIDYKSANKELSQYEQCQQLMLMTMME